MALNGSSFSMRDAETYWWFEKLEECKKQSSEKYKSTGKIADFCEYQEIHQAIFHVLKTSLKIQAQTTIATRKRVNVQQIIHRQLGLHIKLLVSRHSLLRLVFKTTGHHQEKLKGTSSANKILIQLHKELE